MIISVTSKRGGTGCTTLAVIMSLFLAKEFKQKVCLVDLKTSQDLAKLLNLSSSRCIDSLITEIGFNNEHIKLEDNIYRYDTLDVILGTRVPVPTYLYKKSGRIKELLEYLDGEYDIVLLDVSDDMVYDELEDIGLKMFPVNILDQNMLVVREYGEEMKSAVLKGILVVNKLDNRIYPSQDMFAESFPQSKLSFLPYSNNIRTIINSTIRSKGVVPLKVVVKEDSFYSELINICKYLVNTAKKYNSTRLSSSEDLDDFFASMDKLDAKKTKQQSNKSKKKKKSFFSFFTRKER